MTSPTYDLGLLDPADGDAAALIGDEAYLHAMVDTEKALLDALVTAGVLPADTDTTLNRDALDASAIAAAGRATGNTVIPLLSALRDTGDAPVHDALHFGATSQDIIDTATMLVADRTCRRISERLPVVLDRLSELADEHRGSHLAGRTLGQQAAPTTLGLRLAVLLDGITRAEVNLQVAERPAQLGGSVGTLAVLVDRLGTDTTEELRRTYARSLGLTFRPVPWHVQRGAVAELGAALAVFIGALGRLGLELAQGARTEIGELEVVVPEGTGGSSAMPQKRNPVSAVLLVAAARRAPGLASTLLGAQLALDDRPAGDWHAEWQPLRELLRLALESTELARDAVASLVVRPERASTNMMLSGGALHAERAQWALTPYLGRARAAAVVREALDAERFLETLTAVVEDEPGGGPDAVARIGEVTASSGPIGLSDSIIDAARAATRRRP